MSRFESSDFHLVDAETALLKNLLSHGAAGHLANRFLIQHLTALAEDGWQN
jgi:hypothetical protein